MDWKRWAVVPAVLALHSLAAAVEPPPAPEPTEEPAVAAPAELAGQLLIVGGGLRADNETVYGQLFELLDAECTICIIPTASARPANAAANAKRDLSRQRREGITITVVELTTDDPARADDAGVADQLRACDALWFTGGDQSRITRVFLPRSRQTAALKVAQELLASGGVIAGSSAGAAMMSDPMITGGSSRDWIARAWPEPLEDDGEEAEVIPAERLRMGRGLGFFSYGIIDQHFLARGRLGRLVLALEAAGIERGYGIADNRAITVDLATGTIKALGDGACIVLDVSEMARDHGWRNVRLSIISTGDTVDGSTGIITPAKGETVATPRPAKVTEPENTQGEDSNADEETLDPWSRDAVLKLLRRLERDPGTPASASNEEVELRLTADDRTRFYIASKSDASKAADEQPLRALDVRLDLIVR